MSDKLLELVDRPLHSHAVEVARESVDDYAASLVVLAKTLAFQRGDDEVLSTHVYEALNTLQNRKNRTRWKDFLLAIGGALFGAFVSGFVTELSTGHSNVLLTVYVVLGLIGMFAIFAGLQD